MKKLQSPYIVTLLGWLSDEEKGYFFLEINYEENGNLEDFLSDHPTLSDSYIIKIFIDILRGLICLKENKIVHGDLKP